MKKGFSLIELSVVLVVIAVLIAATTTATRMQSQMKLKKVITDFRNYEVALSNFKEEYQQYPGDLDSASTYWPNGCTDYSRTSSEASINIPCDGNGDGYIDHNISGNGVLEGMRMWQHLTLASLIDGSYSGVDALSDYGKQLTPGDNAPATPLDGGCYFGRELTTDWGPAVRVAIISGGFWANERCFKSLYTAKQAYHIDSKIDDGLRNSGDLRALYGPDAAGKCIDGNDYKVSLPDRACRIAYVIEK